jgi:hypothetical protein
MAIYFGPEAGWGKVQTLNDDMNKIDSMGGGEKNGRK